MAWKDYLLLEEDFFMALRSFLQDSVLTFDHIMHFYPIYEQEYINNDVYKRVIT